MFVWWESFLYDPEVFTNTVMPVVVVVSLVIVAWVLWRFMAV